MNALNAESLQSKIDRLEVFVDALLEERRALREDLRRIEQKIRKSGEESQTTHASDELIRNFDDMRRKLAESEANNQKLLRDRGLIKDRLTQMFARLDLIEGRLLEQRSNGGQ